MTNGEPVVWYAQTDDATYAWREGGQWLAASLIPAGLILLASALAGDVLLAPIGLSLLLPLVALAHAARLIAGDRHAVVEVRVAGDRFTLVRADRSTETVPARDVSRIEVIRTRYVGGSTPHCARMRLHVAGRIERTRPGADLCTELADAITTAKVALTVTAKTHQE